MALSNVYTEMAIDSLPAEIKGAYMINVDIHVPSLDRVYNFNLDEESKVSVLIEEISELICKKEQSLLDGDKELFIMGSIDQTVNFNPAYSLKEYSVKNGEELILV